MCAAHSGYVSLLGFVQQFQLCVSERTGSKAPVEMIVQKKSSGFKWSWFNS